MTTPSHLPDYDATLLLRAISEEFAHALEKSLMNLELVQQVVDLPPEIRKALEQHVGEGTTIRQSLLRQVESLCAKGVDWSETPLRVLVDHANEQLPAPMLRTSNPEATLKCDRRLMPLMLGSIYVDSYGPRQRDLTADVAVDSSSFSVRLLADALASDGDEWVQRRRRLVANTIWQRVASLHGFTISRKRHDSVEEIRFGQQVDCRTTK